MFESRKITLLGSAISWSIFIGILCTLAAVRLVYVLDRAYISQEIVTVSQNMQNSLINMTSGERAYILTGDVTYLKPYREYDRTLRLLTNRLKELSIKQNGPYSIDINSLAALDDQKIVSASDLIAFRDKVGLETAAKQFADTNTEISQDELHAIVLSIQTEQISVTNKLSREAHTDAIIIIGGILWLFVCLITDIIIFNRDYKRMRMHTFRY
jgi:CHASE3 domain sensor protein